MHDVLVDLEFYGEWWPQVRAVGKIDDDHALVVCRSTLPYDLELVLTAVSRDLDCLEVGIDGPIRGWARFHLDEQSPGVTTLRFEQEVRAEAPSFVLASYVVQAAARVEPPPDDGAVPSRGCATGRARVSRARRPPRRSRAPGRSAGPARCR